MLKAESELRGRIRFYAMTHLADEAQALANDICEHQGLVERPDHMVDMPRPTIPELEARIEKEIELVHSIACDLMVFK